MVYAAKAARRIRNQNIRIFFALFVQVVLLAVVIRMIAPVYLKVGTLTVPMLAVVCGLAINHWTQLLNSKGLKMKGRESESSELFVRARGLLQKVCGNQIKVPHLVLLDSGCSAHAGAEPDGTVLYLSGFGDNKFILMGAEFFKRLSDVQAEGILAHEIAHSKGWDLAVRKVWNFVLVAAGWAYLGAFAVFLWKGKAALGGTTMLTYLFAAMGVVAVFKNFTLLIAAFVSRAAERKADTLCAVHFDSSEPLILGLRKLRELGTEPRCKCMMNPALRSHPTLEARIDALEELEA